MHETIGYHCILTLNSCHQVASQHENCFSCWRWSCKSKIPPLFLRGSHFKTRTHCFKSYQEFKKRQICHSYHCKPHSCPVRTEKLTGVAAGGRTVNSLWTVTDFKMIRTCSETDSSPAEVGFTPLSLIFSDHSCRQTCFPWNHPEKLFLWNCSVTLCRLSVKSSVFLFLLQANNLIMIQPARYESHP